MTWSLSHEFLSLAGLTVLISLFVSQQVIAELLSCQIITGSQSNNAKDARRQPSARLAS